MLNKHKILIVIIFSVSICLPLQGNANVNDKLEPLQKSSCRAKQVACNNSSHNRCKDIYASEAAKKQCDAGQGSRYHLTACDNACTKAR